MEAVFHPIVEHYKGIPSVSHVRIAENTSNEKESVARLIRTHLDDFERFGPVHTQIVTVKAGRGTSRRKIYWLNEQQAYLIMTFLDNTEIVKMFKIALIQEFFKMRAKQTALPAQCRNELITPQIMAYKSNLAKQRKKIEELRLENAGLRHRIEELEMRLKEVQTNFYNTTFCDHQILDLAGNLRREVQIAEEIIASIQSAMEMLYNRKQRTKSYIDAIVKAYPKTGKIVKFVENHIKEEP